jgi:hypothetical protein
MNYRKASSREEERDGSKLKSLSDLLSRTKRDGRDEMDEEDKDFSIEDHVVKIHKDEEGEAEPEGIYDDDMATDRSDDDADVTSGNVNTSVMTDEMTYLQKNKMKIQRRVRTSIANVDSWIDRLKREKALLEDDLTRLQKLNLREEDLEVSYK